MTLPYAPFCTTQLKGRSLIWLPHYKCPKRTYMVKQTNQLKKCKEGDVDESQSILLRETRVDQSSYASLLKECAQLGTISEAKAIHAHMIRSGSEYDTILKNHLVNAYIKCGDVLIARQLFDKMPQRNMVSWTILITGYVQNGYHKEAIQLFCVMLENGMEPNTFTFGSVLGATAGLRGIQQGKQVHAHIIKSGLQSDGIVSNALCNMFFKCKSMLYARQVFDKMPQRNVISWTAMCTGYVESSDIEEAVKVLYLMQLSGVKPNQFTFTSVLSACGSLASVDDGKRIHGYIIKIGFEKDIPVGNAILDMYAKCGNIEDAQKVFDGMPQRNLISWNAIIGGYSLAEHYGEETLKLLDKMQQAGMKPDLFTFCSVLSACSSGVSLEQGKQVHLSTIRLGLDSNVSVGTALITMYAKLGSIDDARKVFDGMTHRNILSWTAMITGYAQHGYGQEALDCFEEMEEEGAKPNHITYIGVLSACSHVGLVEEGQRFFNSMTEEHGIMPSMDHYACMVDLYGRAGHIDDALELIKGMPFKPSALVWRTLLGACRIYGEMEAGKYAAENLLRLDSEDAATYVLLSNMYLSAGRWSDAANVRKLMREKAVIKEPGQSWIEVKNKVHAFLAGDKSHPQTAEIYAMLETLRMQLEEAGYVPDTSLVMYEEEKQKEYILWHHSERLAIAFGLISIPHGIPIRIVKNLRVCADCHTATKFMSKIVGREIVVRDANRFHHFKDGICSCSDYW